MMKTAYALDQLESLSRQTGRTTAMLNSLPPNSIVITHDHNYANKLKEKLGRETGRRDVTFVPLHNLETLRGRERAPVFYDNAALASIMHSYSRTVAEVEDLKQNKKYLHAQLDHLEAQLTRAQNELYELKTKKSLVAKIKGLFSGK